MQRKLNNQMKELNYRNMASFINMAGAAVVDSHACKTSNDFWNVRIICTVILNSGSLHKTKQAFKQCSNILFFFNVSYRQFYNDNSVNSTAIVQGASSVNNMLLIHTYNGMFEKIIGKFGDELMKKQSDRCYYKSTVRS